MKSKPPLPPATLKPSLMLDTFLYVSITTRFSCGVVRPTTVDVSSYALAAVVASNLDSSADSSVSATSVFGYVTRDLSYPEAVTLTRDAPVVPVSRLYTVSTVECSVRDSPLFELLNANSNSTLVPAIKLI